MMKMKETFNHSRHALRAHCDLTVSALFRLLLFSHGLSFMKMKARLANIVNYLWNFDFYCEMYWREWNKNN